VWLALVLAACGSGATSTPDGRPASVDAPLAADAPMAVDAASSADAAPAPDAATTCVATTAAQLVACAGQVQSGARSVIEIQGDIVCSGVDACRVEIHDRAFTVRGVAGASIRRTDHHDYPLIQAIATPSATIAALTFDEDGSVDCEPISPTNPPVENPACAHTLDFYGVESATLDHVTVVASKSLAASFNTGGSVRITHSRFVAPLQFGVQAGQLTGGFSVEDSLFAQSSSNALALYKIHGTAQAPLVVRNTFFDHNHRDDVYFVCGPQANARCSGGQMLLAEGIDFLLVEKTVLRRGADDVDPNTPVGGVEINYPAVHDVTFAGNDVHTHGMWGIYLNSNPVDVGRISFLNNKLYDNGKSLYYDGVDLGNFPLGIVTETGSCHQAGCVKVTLGMLWAVPGGSFSWVTNDATAPRVVVNGTQTSTDANGQGVGAPDTQVVLYDGATELDRLTLP
jgi:hypothetical protein